MGDPVPRVGRVMKNAAAAIAAAVEVIKSSFVLKTGFAGHGGLCPLEPEIAILFKEYF